MKLSVIIPTLNEEAYIGLLLECLTNQTLKDFEVLIVDGNSTDGTKDKALQYQGLLDIKFINAGKKGVSLQRNLGEKHANTGHLLFMDADGYIEDDFLEKIYKYIRQHTDVDILTTWVAPLSDKKRDKIIFYAYNQFYLDIVKYWKPAGGGAFMYVKRKAFREVGGFDEKIVLAEDHDLIVRMHKKGYKYKLLKRPDIKTSIRRLEKQGRLKYIWSLGRSAAYFHLVGPIQDYNLFKYVMEGGSTYEGVKINLDFLKDKKFGARKPAKKSENDSSEGIS
ncbi:glycosyltransferase [candidate division WWE3 bacterium]|jgi:glycosyltransferase involved in cell wall biosynthesis|uniref:Glycosyltransferase n=1 Tax=candidate division WWE3 bacterium TaxID=2053526 RepID=A0A3A4ZK40_UNCKA|nr:MAG: glycosyltransferase [candidate division WWE3 bacterium]